MKLLALVVCTAIFAAVHGTPFAYKCIKLDITGTVTVTAKNTETNVTTPQVIDLSTVKGATTTGNCTNAKTVTMTVAFNATSWKLTFTNASGQVNLDQGVTFDPAAMFKSCGANGSLTLSTAKSLPLSASNASYQCESEEIVDFTPKTEGNCSFSITQNITSIQVQAFGLSNGTYSPAQHCSGDQTTVAPTTAATTVVPTPTEPVPVKKETFTVMDSKKNVCFRLEAGLQFVVEYETTDKAMVYSKVITVHNSKVNGTCAGSGNTATMVIGEEDSSKLTITETRSKDAASSALQLDVTLDAANFPKALHVNKTVSFQLNRTFEQSRADTFYQCESEQTLELKSENTSALLYTNDVQMQAFNLKNGSFSGQGAPCGLDPRPLPPASKPGDNQYVVRENASIVCLVVKGEISFSNVTYMKKGGMAQANTISIPTMNKTLGNVLVNGSCDLEKGNAQQLVITFNRNWTLTLTFARGTSKDSSMLTATNKEFTLRDIELVYYLVPEFFPNATSPYVMVVANQTNITSDFMKGSIGGSYKCDAKQTEQLNNGIELQTAKFQFKAFNNDNYTTFNNNVSECSADDESNSIVPIAVGAALAGLVAIVLIAYLIGRRRSRRQGYESV